MSVRCGIFLALAAVLRAVLTQSAVEYCVRPSQPALKAAFDGDSLSVHRAFVDSQCIENKTWNEYLAKQDRYFKSNVEFRFLPGVHFMNRSLEVNDVSNMSFSGKGPSSVTLKTDTVEHSLSVVLNFTSFSHVTIKGLRFLLCASPSILGFSLGTDVTIVNAEFENPCDSCDISAENLKNIAIKRTLVTGGSLCFSQNISDDIEIKESTFVASFNASVDLTFISFSTVNDAFVLIESCNFSCGSVIATHNQSRTQLILNDIRANGCQYSPMGFLVIGTSGNFNLTKSDIIGFKLALMFITYSSSMLLHAENCSLHNNIGANPLGGAMNIISNEYDNQTHTLTNVSFSGNGFVQVHEAFTISSAPTLLIFWSSVDIINCHFVSNQGNALFIYNSSIRFFGYNYFGYNTGYQGAAMYLGQGAEIQLILTLVVFERNHANLTGGAIHIAGGGDTSRCPFAYPIFSTLNFSNNVAGVAGDAVYGGDLDQSYVFHYGNTYPCIEILKQNSHFEQPNNLSVISSRASRVCLCKSKVPTCLTIFSNESAYPGEEFKLSAVAVGQNFGTTTGYVHAQLLQGTDNASLGELQNFQLVHQHQCNLLPYTIYSKRKKEILVLTAKTTVVYVYGNKTSVNKSIQEYNENKHSYMPEDLLQFPVYINVTLRQCPPGFNLTDFPPYKCECSKRFQHLQGKVLDIVYSKYCPYNYCNPNKVKVNISSGNSQCQYNHSGMLCGNCSEGLSLTLGKSECRTCSNIYLLLIAPFAVGGIALVVFIKVTDFTVAVGLINGLILYANLVKANDYMFFTGGPKTLNSIMQVIIAWLNLDLGIETCFFGGLDGYWKTWLQFVFPIYIWTISVVMILLARYSMRMARLLGNNSVPVLATLFTLSYAKLIRTVITIFNLAIIDYPHDHNKVVWSYDGNIEYWDEKHTPLFAVAVLVLLCLWLPYTSVLLLGQCLQRCNILKIGRFTARMKPFFDAHYGPFKDRHRYWFGVLLIARTIPLLVDAFTPLSSSTITPLSTIAVTGALLMYSFVVYKKWYVSLSEGLFLLNLLFLSGSALYTASSSVAEQGWFTAVLVGIAIVHCVVIIVFNAMKHFLLKCTKKNDDPLLINSVHDYNDLSFRRDVPDT